METAGSVPGMTRTLTADETHRTYTCGGAQWWNDDVHPEVCYDTIPATSTTGDEQAAIDMCDATPGCVAYQYDASSTSGQSCSSVTVTKSLDAGVKVCTLNGHPKYTGLCGCSISTHREGCDGGAFGERLFESPPGSVFFPNHIRAAPHAFQHDTKGNCYNDPDCKADGWFHNYHPCQATALLTEDECEAYANTLEGSTFVSIGAYDGYSFPNCFFDPSGDSTKIYWKEPGGNNFNWNFPSETQTFTTVPICFTNLESCPPLPP